MYHQKVPSYDGAQPFIYAVYCKEDESLAYPVLARMYNEGFRVCCAPSTGISSDYYMQQRLQSASGLIMFMSHQMAERLRTGDPDVLAAARSPLLRTLILLDDTDVKNNIFAMAVPDHQPYIRENDSAFWLYIYSNDYFDKCRGKWPERKLLLRDPNYEDISAEVVSEEYRRLENIMSGAHSESRTFDPFDPDTMYPNNAGYIEPEPDEYIYEPLERIEAVRTEHDDQFDEVLNLIDQAETAVQESRRRTAEATAIAEENAKTAADSVAQREEALEKSKLLAPEPELIILTTVDAGITEAEEPAEAEQPQNEAETPIADEETDTFEAVIASEPVTAPTDEERSAAAEAIVASAQVLLDESADGQPDVQVNNEPAEVSADAEQDEAEAAEPLSQPVAVQEAAELEPLEPIVKVNPARRSSVPVMVRRQQTALRSRVEVRRRRAVHVSPTPASAHRSAMHLSSMPTAEELLPHAISDSITFEQYVRDIARTCVSELLEQPDEQSAVVITPARKHRQRITATVAAQVVPEAAPQYSIELVSAENDSDAEVKSHRKSRHPHQKGSLFSNLVNAFRSQRLSREQAELDESETDSNFESEFEPDINEIQLMSDNACDDVDETVCHTHDLEASADLQSVVEKFIECNRVPSITVVPRTMIRRYRD